MASKERGGLSKREYAAKMGGTVKSSSKSISSSSLKAPKAPKIKEFKFDSSKLLPQYQQEAASLYAPQLQQLGQLREITKGQAEEAKVRTNADFARLLEREKESINQRGAFFGGGAVDRENRIGAEQGYALRGIEQQAQLQNLDYDTTQGNIGQAQKDYVAGKVEGAFSSAYQTFRDKVSDAMSKYQMELGQYNQDRAFEQSKLESDRQYELSRAAAGRAGGNASQTKLDDLLTRASQMGEGGREWAASVASQYGVDPAAVSRLTAKDGWEKAYNTSFGSVAKPKLSAGQTTAIADMDATIEAARAAKDIAKKVNTGPLAGRAGKLGQKVGLAGDDFVDLNTRLVSIKANFMKAISGAAVSEQEAERLAQFLPDVTDDDNVIQRKLENLESNLSRTRNSLLSAASGQNLNQTGENVYDVNGVIFELGEDGLYYEK